MLTGQRKPIAFGIEIRNAGGRNHVAVRAECGTGDVAVHVELAQQQATRVEGQRTPARQLRQHVEPRYIEQFHRGLTSVMWYS